MPIPVLVWAAGAAVGGWLAWKNRKAIGKGLEAIGNSLATRATREVDDLLAMPLPSAEHQVDAMVPGMDPLYWSFFQQELGKRSLCDSKASCLLMRAMSLRKQSP